MFQALPRIRSSIVAVACAASLVPYASDFEPRRWSSFLVDPPGWAAFADVPAEEILFGERLPMAAPNDGGAEVHGRPDGQVAVLWQENYRILSATSADSGANFAPEVVVGGGPAQLPVQYYLSTMSPDGTLHVVLSVIDPLGGLGFQAVRSTDMGRTWSAPVDLVRHGDPQLGARTGPRQCNALASGTGGRVAFLFGQEGAAFVYVLASADGGATWGELARIDSAADHDLGGVVPYPDLAFGADGTLHAAWNQYRTVASVDYPWALLYARSLDGGVTFEPERVIRTRGMYPDVEVASDGSILIASVASNRVNVMRSADNGSTFVDNSLAAIANMSLGSAPRIRPSPDSATVLLAAAARDTRTTVLLFGPLWVWRSTNNGATFGAPVQLAATARRTNPAVQRTPSGTWVVAWTDGHSDSYAGVNTDVYARSSADDGTSWGAIERADSDAPGAAPSSFGTRGLATAGSAGIVAGWTDSRNDAHRGGDIYTSRSSVLPLAFAPDLRVDTDQGTLNAFQFADGDLVTDGDHHVYTAFHAQPVGPYYDVYVAASADGGYTYADPVRASRFAPGSRICKLPKLAARPDGNVYLLYQDDDPIQMRREIRLTRSNDFGASWPASDTLVGLGAASLKPSLMNNVLEYENVQLALGAIGEIWVAWSAEDRVSVAHSIDHGATFTVADVAAQPDWYYYGPGLCVHGGRILVSYAADNPVSGSTEIWAVTSPDAGGTWSSPQSLQTSAPGSGVGSLTFCAQGPGPEALVTWDDYRSGRSAIAAARWGGTAWEADQVVQGSPGRDLDTLLPAVWSSPNVIVVVAATAGDVYVSRSIDGGISFGPPARLDDAAPVPDTSSGVPFATADGIGNVWIVWEDGSTGGQLAEVVRHSGDNGATFGPVYRLSRNQPQGGQLTRGWWGEGPTDTLPGAMFMTYGADRLSDTEETAVNVYDVNDFDRDKKPAALDCNDSDPTAAAVPAVVAGVAVSRLADHVRVLWTPQAAAMGTGTRYDIVTGSLSSLHADAGYLHAVCLAQDLAAPFVDDGLSLPAQGDGVWWLVRAHNSCGTGGYGAGSGALDPRGLLNASSPCP